MKELFNCLLAIFTLTHFGALAMDPPPIKIGEKSPLIQVKAAEAQSSQAQIINFRKNRLNNALTMHAFPNDPELAVILSMGMGLLARKGSILSPRKAPYYKNLLFLIEYLVGSKPEQDLLQRDNWKKAITDLEDCLSSLQKQATDTTTLGYLDIISSDTSLDKSISIRAYFDLIEHIIQKHNIP